MSNHKPAILALEDGSIFRGETIGVSGTSVGEVVFNTAMTGYQEILTDPSYASQIITFTYPHIGNVGTNHQDFESEKAWVAGLIIRDYSPITSNWRSELSLADFLKQQKIAAIANIDTRRLTRLLRHKGALAGCITTEEPSAVAIDHAKTFSGLSGLDLTDQVSTKKVYEWKRGSDGLTPDEQPFSETSFEKHVVVFDCGVKHNILRMLVDRGCRLTVVPANTTVDVAMSYQPDGIFFSNGPGDPAACQDLIHKIKQFLAMDMPLFGICLGHQLIALALGAKTIKMKFGHHGANHPVQNVETKQVFITSQNHGFTVDEQSLPSSLYVTYRSLFDGSLQGIAHRDKPVFAFQGHPEASPGPHDVQSLFDRFIAMMKKSELNYAEKN